MFPIKKRILFNILKNMIKKKTEEFIVLNVMT